MSKNVFHYVEFELGVRQLGYSNQGFWLVLGFWKRGLSVAWRGNGLLVEHGILADPGKAGGPLSLCACVYMNFPGVLAGDGPSGGHPGIGRPGCSLGRPQPIGLSFGRASMGLPLSHGALPGLRSLARILLFHFAAVTRLEVLVSRDDVC